MYVKKNTLIALGVVAALILSSVSVVVSLTPLFETRRASDNPMPHEGFMFLGARPGFGAGTFSINPDDDAQKIYDFGYRDFAHPWTYSICVTVTNEATELDAVLYVSATLKQFGIPVELVVAYGFIGPGDSITLTVPPMESLGEYAQLIPDVMYMLWIELTPFGTAPVNGYYFVHFFLG